MYLHNVLSPRFIDIPMTKGYGAKLTPQQCGLSSLKCLFGQTVKSGYYYGSDGLRSPLTVSWDMGTPEYQGEADPDALNTTSECGWKNKTQAIAIRLYIKRNENKLKKEV